MITEKFSFIAILTTMFICSVNLYAIDLSGNFQNQTANNQQQNQQQYDQNGNPIPLITKEFPVDTNNQRTRFYTPELQKDRFELDMSQNVAKGVIDKSDRYTKILTETIDLNLLVNTSVRQIKATDTIYIHPHFITTIAFPPKTEIIYMKSSVPLDTFNYSSNLLMIQPTKDFVNGNLLITYRDNQKTYYTNIIIQKYTQMVFKDEYFNRYVIDDNYLSLNYQYVSNVNYNEIDILKKYFQLNGDNAIKHFKKNGDYDMILINGVSYYVIRDNNFGSIDYMNTRFTISQNYSYGDKSVVNKRIDNLNDFYPSTKYAKNKSKVSSKW